jgi:hypothetical protein
VRARYAWVDPHEDAQGRAIDASSVQFTVGLSF